MPPVRLASVHATLSGTSGVVVSSLRTTEEKVEANGKAENDKVWDALDRQRAALDSVKEYVFKENATKNDLNAMERRIMSAIEKAGR
jgi:hypothetical protein